MGNTILIKKLYILVLLTFITFKLAFMPFIVSGASMEPTLHTNNIGLAKNTKVFKHINRFNIVIIKQENRYLIKRVIGLPGEVVEYKDNKLYINGQETMDPYCSYTNDFNVTLTHDEYFCMGDNRENSADSRMFGPFKQYQVVGVAIN